MNLIKVSEAIKIANNLYLKNDKNAEIQVLNLFYNIFKENEYIYTLKDIYKDKSSFKNCLSNMHPIRIFSHRETAEKYIKTKNYKNEEIQKIDLEDCIRIATDNFYNKNILGFLLNDCSDLWVALTFVDFLNMYCTMFLDAKEKIDKDYILAVKTYNQMFIDSNYTLIKNSKEIISKKENDTCIDFSFIENLNDDDFIGIQKNSIKSVNIKAIYLKDILKKKELVDKNNVKMNIFDYINLGLHENSYDEFINICDTFINNDNNAKSFYKEIFTDKTNNINQEINLPKNNEIFYEKNNKNQDVNLPAIIEEKSRKSKQKRNNIIIKNIFFAAILMLFFFIIGYFIINYITPYYSFNFDIKNNKYSSALDLYNKNKNNDKFKEKAILLLNQNLENTIESYLQDNISVEIVVEKLNEYSRFEGMKDSIEKYKDYSSDIENSKNSYILGQKALDSSEYLEALDYWNQVFTKDSNYQVILNTIHNKEETIVSNSLLECLEYLSNNDTEHYEYGLSLLKQWYPKNNNVNKYYSQLDNKYNKGFIVYNDSFINNNVDLEKEYSSDVDKNNPIEIKSTKVSMPKSNGSVDLYIEWVNKTGKTIKSVSFIVQPFDEFGNEMKCNKNGYSYYKANANGSWINGDGMDDSFYWPQAWFNTRISTVKILKAEIVYIDDTKDELNLLS